MNLAILLLQVGAGIYLLVRHYRRAENNIERRQTRLVLLGSGVGLVIFSAYVFLMYSTIILRLGLPIVGWFLLTTGVFVILLLSPITLAYAFGRYRLLDVEGRLRRGTRYVMAVIFLILTVVGVAYAENQVVSNIFEAGSPLAIFVMSAVVLGVFRGAQKLRSSLETRFFPERGRLRLMISDFLQRTTSVADKVTFWSMLEDRLRECLNVQAVYPVFLQSDTERFLLRDAVQTPFRRDSELIRQLAEERRALMVDEAICCLPVAEEEADWLSAYRVEIILPIIAHDKLIGFLGIGAKTIEEDYTAEELRILSSLAPQVALASDNMRLLEENVIKQRLEEELHVARRVQEGFLPHDLPPTPGLEIAAHTNFCLEVAGDYYDVIALPDGRTALAVGDVSGKGAGAALIMANLQASMRALCGVGLPLTELMGRINRLICQNTSNEQLITFFVAIFWSQGSNALLRQRWTPSTALGGN